MTGDPGDAGDFGDSGSPRAVFREFLRLGSVGFGGPAAHLALFRQRFVRELGWLDEQAFLDLIGAANLLPGPTSTEVALGIGRRRAGMLGLLAAGLGFIGPAVLAVLLLAVGYERFGSRPEIGWVLYGIQPVVVAVVAVAVAGLAPTALRGPATFAIAAAAAAAILIGVDPLLVVAGAVVAGIALAGARRSGEARRWLASFVPWFPLGPGSLPAGLFAATSLAGHGLVFLKIGLFSFGSGYVLLAFLRSDLVGPGLLTDRQLLDAVAVGQVTPGPVYTTATFIGYLLLGVPGALVATVAIFLPAFVGVALIHPFLGRVRASPAAAAFLDAINAASLGLIAAVTVQLGRGTLIDGVTVVLAAAALLVLLRWRQAAVPLLIGGGVVGLVVHAVWRA